MSSSGCSLLLSMRRWSLLVVIFYAYTASAAITLPQRGSSTPSSQQLSNIGSIDCTSKDSFQCSAGVCIPSSWRCDGDYDCLNKKDEEDCKDENECKANEFKCDAKAARIAHLFRRAKTDDDEDLKPEDHAHKCIPKEWQCDGAEDCDDGSDELHCKNVECKDDHFACEELDGRFTVCIPMQWKCDGQQDCSSGKDEQNCNGATNMTCPEKEFNCGTECIYEHWRCDGEKDCPDGEDEEGCKDTVKQCNQEQFKCGRQCISKEWRCDGHVDCADHSDEENCPTVDIKCKTASEVPCKTGGGCISHMWLCDGERDCPDGSDEENCTPVPCKEDGNNYLCRGHQTCVDKSKLCDGVEDCPQADDETECKHPVTPAHVPTCEEGRDFSCPSMPSMCVPMDKLCTDAGRYACGDDLTCANDITLCAKNSDACTCRKTYKNTTVCHCMKGFASTNNNTACQDVNECETPGRCDQICVNTRGSFKCSCHGGYHLMTKDGDIVPSRCRANGNDPLLLLSNRATIRQYDMVTRDHLPLVQSPGSAVAMDYHMRNKSIFWSDIARKKILRCEIGSQVQGHHLGVKESCSNDQVVIVDGDVHTPDGLAVDWVHDLLFWTDGALDTISVMDLKTGRRRVLFNDELEEPRAIAVDPEKGLIFWTDWGKEARIERAGMDGNNRKVILNGTNIKWPNGLALDLLEKRVYWADAKVKSIYSSDYYGNDVKVVLHSHNYLRHPFSLAVFEDRVYYTDWEHDGVMVVNKFNGEGVSKLMGSVATPMTVRIYHQVTQPDHPNKCDDHTCGSALCLPRAMIRTRGASASFMTDQRPYSCICEGSALVDKAACLLEEAESLTGGPSFFSAFLILFMIGVAGSGVFVYMKRRSARSFTALQFDNPVYRRTTEPDSDPFRANVGMDDIQVPVHPARLVIHDDHDDNTMIDRMDRPLTT